MLVTLAMLLRCCTAFNKNNVHFWYLFTTPKDLISLGIVCRYVGGAVLTYDVRCRLSDCSFLATTKSECLCTDEAESSTPDSIDDIFFFIMR